MKLYFAVRSFVVQDRDEISVPGDTEFREFPMLTEILRREGTPMARIPFVRHRTANRIRARYRACRHAV